MKKEKKLLVLNSITFTICNISQKNKSGMRGGKKMPEDSYMDR